MCCSVFGAQVVGNQAQITVSEPLAANVDFNSAHVLTRTAPLWGCLLFAAALSKRASMAILLVVGVFCLVHAVCLTSVTSVQVGVPAGDTPKTLCT